jgi:hypothetical protein
MQIEDMGTSQTFLERLSVINQLNLDNLLFQVREFFC